MKRRPTKRAVVITLVGGLLFLAGITAQASWLFVMSAGVLSLVAASALTRHHLVSTEIERSLPRRARIGDDLRMGISIRNTGSRGLPPHRLEDSFPAFEEAAVLVERLDPGASAHVELVKTARRRGAFTSGTVVQKTGAPFGLSRTVRTIEIESELIVVPNWVDLPSFPILEPSSFPSDLLHERARTGAGEEFLGVRDYRPGDPPRSVHWRSTARAGHLIVREFEEQVASRVSLVLGGMDVGVPPESAFEALVSAAASIGIYALSTGHPLHGVCASPHGPQQLNEPDRYALLDWLARATPTDESLRPLTQLALDRVGRRGTVVLFAPTIGNAGASVRDAIRLVQSAGARPIVVGASADSWLTGGRGGGLTDIALVDESDWRAGVHLISAGDDLRWSLA